MKKTILILTACAAFVFSAGAADGQKIATIDLRKVFDSYWRTKQADANLKDQAADLEKERQVMVDQFQKGEANYKKLLDSANDQALSVTEREKRKKDAESELLNLRDMETRVKQFDNTSRTTLGEKQRRMRDNILQEIRDTVKARVKSTGHTLVLDIAAETVNGTPIVLFTAGSDDITDSVLAQLNINAPAAPPAAKTETKPEK
ncbi:MAG TPA: OmpH family outer membrane protein [Methylomirabilota bacterium]|nr:OmpH family outer membrane protein [Methylomirabilota bacterium]